MAGKTGFFRGAGGTIFEIDLPLSEPLQYQLERRDLVRVNADGSDFDDGPPAVPVHDPRDAEIARLQAELAKLQASAPPAPPTGAIDAAGNLQRPRDSGSKSDWAAYAVFRGMTVSEADSYTRDQLVELYPREPSE